MLYQVICLVMIPAVIGHVLFCIVSFLDWGKWLVLIGRFLVGCSTGCIACGRAYIDVIAPADQRDRFLSWTLAAQYFGYALAPGLCSVFSGIAVSSNDVLFNNATVPCYFLAALCFITATLVWFYLDRIPPQPKGNGPPPAAATAAAAGASESAAAAAAPVSPAAAEAKDCSKHAALSGGSQWTPSMVLFLCLYLVNRSGMAIVETIAKAATFPHPVAR